MGDSYNLVRSPDDTVHAVHKTIRGRTVCGGVIASGWAEIDPDYHPNFCYNCQRLIKSKLDMEAYSHIDAEPENTVRGEPRYFIYARNQGEQAQHLFAKRGSRKKAHKSLNQVKRENPEAVMAAILDREKDEVTHTEEWDAFKTVKQSSTRTLLHELAERFLHRGKEEKVAMIQDILND